jgi:hypothetical protein
MRTHQELDQARRTLSRWRETVCERSQPYLDQWEQVLNTGLLTNQERFAFLKAWKQDHASQRA